MKVDTLVELELADVKGLTVVIESRHGAALRVERIDLSEADIQSLTAPASGFESSIADTEADKALVAA